VRARLVMRLGAIHEPVTARLVEAALECLAEAVLDHVLVQPGHNTVTASISIGASGTSNYTELEKLKKCLQFVMYCIDCFVS
jgi:hypothetical protein